MVRTDRAYSLLEIKALDAAQRIIEGIATSASTDRAGDVVEPSGATFDLPIPLLWQHDSTQPIGQVLEARHTKAGIYIKARIASVSEPGILKDRLDEAWQSIAAGLVRGLSIGFKSLEHSFDKTTGGMHFLKWLWLELSAVTIPANADASIATIKHYDSGAPAPGPTAVALPAGAAASPRILRMHKDPIMKTRYAEQITNWENTRAAKAARQDEIQTKATTEGRAKDAAEREEFDTLAADLKGIDAELVDLRVLEAREMKMAAPVAGTTSTEAAASRAPQSRITTHQTLPPGVGFARMVACKAHAAAEMRGGNFITPLEVAKSRYPDDSALRAIFEKTAVAAGTTSGSHAYDDLVPYRVLESDFIEYLRPKTIIGQFGQGGIPDLRRVPFNVRVGGFSAGLTGYWKGESKPIPVSRATSTNVTLTWATVAGLTVVSKEMVAHSTPSAELALRNDLAAAIIYRMDVDFVDPAKAAVSNVSPASITYGLVAVGPTGTAATNVRHDLATLLAAFAAANLGRSNLVLIMSDTMAGNIGMMVNTLGQADFPEMSLGVGTMNLRGIPVITSEALTAVGSPSTQTIVLVKSDEIFLADDGNVSVDASMEASIEMLDASLLQDGTNGTGASLVNMWQTGDIALRAMREINWKLRRSTAVKYISPAAYAVPTS